MIVSKISMVGFFTLLGFLISPSLVSAQAYVPVKDIDLNPAFNTYSNNFDNYATAFDNYATLFDESVNTNTDSLRNIVASGDPQGVSKEKIKKQRKISAYFLFLSEIIFLSFFKNESKSNKKK